MMMTLTQSVHLKSMAFQCPQGERFLLGQPISITLTLPRTPLSWSVLHSSSVRNLGSTIAAASSSSRRKKKKSFSHNHVKDGAEEEEEEEEDAFELLFKQLDEDLKNDDLSIDDGDDEITEEDLARFEQELGDALGDIDTETLGSVINDTETNNLEEDDIDDGDERPVELKNWQLRRLAKALKDGRRKTSIKSLAAELCLDRSIVLELLRDPPPNLLMMSLALPDKPAATLSVSETKTTEAVPQETRVDPEGPETEAKLPVHVMHKRWSDQKRLKKAQVDTLERIYRRTKRPTNAMISSIVHVTNLPRRRVVKWFEDKRTEDGVPDKRLPYQRSDCPVP